MTKLPEDVLAHLMGNIAVAGVGYVRFKMVDDSLVTEVLTRDQLHCPTCQCNKIHPTPPVPGNLMSKSWHENAGKGPK